MRRLPSDLILKLLLSITVLSLWVGCSLIHPTPKPSSPAEPVVDQPQKEEPPPAPPREPPPAAPAKPPPPLPAPPPEKPRAAPAPALRVTQVEWPSVNLREGPGMNYKVVGSAKKGTSLGVLEDKGQWLRVRLEDEKEVWVYKAATSLAPKPASPNARPKPKPM